MSRQGNGVEAVDVAKPYTELPPVESSFEVRALLGDDNVVRGSPDAWYATEASRLSVSTSAEHQASASTSVAVNVLWSPWNSSVESWTRFA